MINYIWPIIAVIVPVLCKEVKFLFIAWHKMVLDSTNQGEPTQRLHFWGHIK
jgi:hypothetical protein